MKIAIIGTGNIGGTLGTRFRAAGYDVAFGASHPRDDGPGGAPVLAAGDALSGADVVLLAVPGRAVPDVLSTHRAALAGKIVIDAVNRIGEPEFDSRALIAAAVPDARYVRAFNSLGWENFAAPIPGANLFYAADPEARAAAEELIAAIGLERRPTSGTPARLRSSTGCCRCGSPSSRPAAGTASSRCASSPAELAR